ncbi:MAG: globin domain-containing protein [Acidimicrobiales bacterium]
MTPEQVELVRATIAAVAEHPEFADRFYLRLFEVAPATEAMFGDLESQRQKLTDELAAMGELLGDLATLDARAAELGRRHRGYGVRAGHYPVARAVMAETVREVLGESFGPEEQAAWERATMLITELMQSG